MNTIADKAGSTTAYDEKNKVMSHAQEQTASMFATQGLRLSVEDVTQASTPAAVAPDPIADKANAIEHSRERLASAVPSAQYLRPLRALRNSK